MRDGIVSKRCGFKRKSNVKQDLQRTGKRVRVDVKIPESRMVTGFPGFVLGLCVPEWFDKHISGICSGKVLGWEKKDEWIMYIISMH